MNKQHRFLTVLSLVAMMTILVAVSAFLSACTGAEETTEATTAPTTEATTEQTEEDTTEETTEEGPVLDGVTVIVGDSRASAFANYGLWPKNQVQFTFNAVLYAEESIFTNTVAQNPARIIFMNGIDDLMSFTPYWANVNYEKYIMKFLDQLPNVDVYVVEVLPVTEEAAAGKEGLQGIDELNKLNKEMCQKNNWTYVECSEGFDPAYYANDGIHYKGDTWVRIQFQNIRNKVGF